MGRCKRVERRGFISSGAALAVAHLLKGSPMLASAADRAAVKLYYIEDESLKARQQVLETKKYLAQLHY